MKFCTNCGAQIQDNDAFCVSCGAPQQATPQQSAQQPQQPAQQPMQQPMPQYQQPQYPQRPQQQPMQQPMPHYQQPQYPQQPVQQPAQQPMPHYQQPQYPQQPMQQPAQQPMPQYQQPQYPQRPQQQPMQQPMPQYQQAQYPQQPHQRQQMQQAQSQFVSPSYPPGTPVVTLRWKGTTGASSLSLSKSNFAVTIKVNGQQIVPDGALSFKGGFSIDIPTESNMRIEVIIRTKGLNFGGTKNVYELELNPSESYIMELTDYAKVYNLLCLGTISNMNLGYKLYDPSYNYLFEYAETKWTTELLCFLIPIVGIVLCFTAENRIVRFVYIQVTLLGLLLWTAIILIILGI